MALFDRLRGTLSFIEEGQNRGTQIGLIGPWSDQSSLAKVVWSEVFQGSDDVVTRESALAVPGVSRALGLLKSAIADLPLVAYRGDEKLATQPSFLQRTPKGTLSPWHRMAWTVDDCFFYGVSVWAVERGAAGQIVNALRIPYERWNTREGRIFVDDKPVSAEEVLVIPGPVQGGFLATAANTIRGARAMEQAWIGRVQNPFPYTVITQTDDSGLTPDEVDQLIENWSKARTSPTGSVGFVPKGFALSAPNPGDDSALFIEGRNAVRLDVANFANIPASLLDGSTATASLTYVTTEGQASSFHEQSVRFWLAPIEHSLSGDDVVPQGQRIRADITYSTQVPPTGEATDD